MLVITETAYISATLLNYLIWCVLENQRTFIFLARWSDYINQFYLKCMQRNPSFY